MKNELRKIPGVDRLLNEPRIKKLVKKHGLDLVKYGIRNVLEGIRNDLTQVKSKKEKVKRDRANEDYSDIISRINNYVESIANPSLKKVINATGIVLHTNLGRAPIGKEILRDAEDIIAGYSNLEFDLHKAKRGQRSDHISELVKFVTKAEDAIVVNNNAAGVMLSLNTFAKGKEVIVSRGELIEIGGSFRIPEIMKASGVKMVEVGTTNRTRISDYKKAITDKTKIIFKAHKSNYYIGGFTEEVEIKELSALAKKHNLILIYDIGSGLLCKPKGLPLYDEPDVVTSLKEGADLITFSCDKLLGGPQAGIVAGKKELVQKLVKAPMMRTLRVDKIIIALLNSVMKNYINEKDQLGKLPAYQMLGKSKRELKSSAQKLSKIFDKYKIASEVVKSEARAGGGTLPNLILDSFAVKIIFPSNEKLAAEKLYKQLLLIENPILGILRSGELLFDLLTLTENEFEHIAKSVARLKKN